MTELSLIKLFKKKIFLLNRSLGGQGNYKTLRFIKKIIPNLKLYKIKPSQNIFDWHVPATWSVKEAYIKDENNKKVIDIRNNFLHVLNYSSKIKKTVSKRELFKHLYFLKRLPNAIPYVTSYYYKKWGFCIQYNQLKTLKSKKFKVFINSSFSQKRKLDYGELFVKGKSKKEILFSTYICHPNLGNDNFSGIIINSLISNYLKSKKTKYSYRLIFIPETIGSIYYIKKNLYKLKNNLLAGYVLTCLGRGKKLNTISKYNDNFSLKLLTSFLKRSNQKYTIRNWKDRGSDERQFSSPNVNLPFSLITKKKFMEYKEYHTSLDNLNYIRNDDLLHSFKIIKNFINYIENQELYLSNHKCEPFLSKYNLYSKISSSYSKNKEQDNYLNVIDYCDGKNTLNDISNLLKIKKQKLNIIINNLKKKKLIKNL